MAISKIKENSLDSGAITESNVGSDIINAQTELAETANDADFILVYDTSAGALKKVLKSNFTLQVPTITSISPSTVASDGSTLHNITINGSGFSTSPTVTFVDTNGATYTSGTVTRNSATQLVAATTATMAAANDPHDIKVTNSNGLAATLEDSLDMGSTPTFVSAAGSLATVFDGARGNAVTATISDPDSSGTIEVSVSAGSLPAGASLSQSQSPGLTTVSISGILATAISSCCNTRLFSSIPA